MTILLLFERWMRAWFTTGLLPCRMKSERCDSAPVSLQGVIRARNKLQTMVCKFNCSAEPALDPRGNQSIGANFIVIG